jgi:hypothetical protein
MGPIMSNWKPPQRQLPRTSFDGLSRDKEDAAPASPGRDMTEKKPDKQAGRDRQRPSRGRHRVGAVRNSGHQATLAREPSGERLRRIGNGEGGNGQMVRRVHAVEPIGTLAEAFQTKRGVILASMVDPMAATAIAKVPSTMRRAVIASPAPVP